MKQIIYNITMTILLYLMIHLAWNDMELSKAYLICMAIMIMFISHVANDWENKYNDAIHAVGDGGSK